MKHFGYGKTLLMAVFMLLASMSALAEEVSKTVTLTAAGTLSTKIGDDQKYKITSLSVSGPINGTEVRYLREMAGMDVNGKSTVGKLADLDLTDANIVEGGECYCYDYYTTNNTLGDNMFYNCGLTSIKIPNSVTSIGNSAFRGCSYGACVFSPFLPVFPRPGQGKVRKRQFTDDDNNAEWRKIITLRQIK